MRFIADTQTTPRDGESAGLKVIAAGQWRCTTSSLQVAFEEILQPSLAPSMHGAVGQLNHIPNETSLIFVKYMMPSTSRMNTAHRATLEKDRHKRQHLLHEIFSGYNASSDWPGHAFIDDLIDMYPDVKVILNKRRTPQEWERSVRSSLAFFSTWTYFFLTCWIPICYCHHRMYRDYMQLARQRYVVDDIFTAECYDRHNEWVREVASARGKEVLEWEPDDGWEPLCKFLGYEVPPQQFPVTNDTAEIEQLKVVLVKRGLLAWALVVGAVMVLIIVVLYLLKSKG